MLAEYFASLRPEDHDSGTADHEPTSLRMHTPAAADAAGGGAGGAAAAQLEPAVLLHLERCAHRKTRRQLQQLQSDVRSLETMGRQPVASELESLHIESEASLGSLASLASLGGSDRLLDELKLRELTISQLRGRVLQLERARLDKIPLEPAREITRLQANMVQLERVRDELTLQNFTLKAKLAEFTRQLNSQGVAFRLDSQPPANGHINGLVSGHVNGLASGHVNGLASGLRDGTKNSSRRETAEASSLTTNISSCSLDDSVVLQDVTDRRVGGVTRTSTYRVGTETAELRKLRYTISELQQRGNEQQQKLSELETQLLNKKNQEDALRALEARLEESHTRQKVTEKQLSTKQEELHRLRLELATFKDENARLKASFSSVMLQEKENSVRLLQLAESENKLARLLEEHRTLSESLSRERLLRKKYHNQAEELKGRIRVFCRLRPLSDQERRGGPAPLRCADEFTLCVDADRGQREFQFDRVFSAEAQQDEVFQDIEGLLQSAVDGYNVCICAYGQTGSGKTHTLLGDASRPGVAPRAFSRLFQLTGARAAQFSFNISTYMLELYNDRLLDLLTPASNRHQEKLEVRRDRRGLVYVQGATMVTCRDGDHLHRLFQQAVSGRHTASTRLNAASSRSHLVIGVIVQATSRVNGTLLTGKLSLLDLAGSERVTKSGATADQLKEANSINRSLSALADVIASLAAEQSFIPYRNNRLTQLMQDSLGGNAKTLMFVNVSPAVGSLDESLVSLQYASRVKQVTNTAARNAESREIARLKNIIAKLKQRNEASYSSDEGFES